MAYRTRPRFQARVQNARRAETARPRRGDERELVGAPAAASRHWDSTSVLDALTELHNAPVRPPTER